MSIGLRRAEAEFAEKFGSAPEIVTRAPGRVNIIGHHTDYTHGFVLPMAIDREPVILARRREDRVSRQRGHHPGCVFNRLADLIATGDLSTYLCFELALDRFPLMHLGPHDRLRLNQASYSGGF